MPKIEAARGEDAGLLLGSSDDEETRFPVVSKVRRTSDRRSVSLFVFILGAFSFGCLSGVVIMRYRISHQSPNSRVQLSSPLNDVRCLPLNQSFESEFDASSRLEDQWRSMSNVFDRVAKISYDLTMAKFSPPSSQWSGIQVLRRETDDEVFRVSCVSTEEYLTLSSLVKSGRVDVNRIIYVDDGRLEDLNQTNEQSIVFIRRRSSTAQIRQAIRHHFAGLVLFDDPREEEEQRSSGPSVDPPVNDEDNPICVLLLSYSDVQKIFSANLSAGVVVVEEKRLRLITHLQEIPVHLPNVFGLIRGDEERFVMIGIELARREEEKVIEEIIRIFQKQLQRRWKPRRSILFAAWSGLSYEHYTVRRWIDENRVSIERTLLSYLDVRKGNRTLNVHGSSRLQTLVNGSSSVAGRVELHPGIPSLLIEMTEDCRSSTEVVWEVLRPLLDRDIQPIHPVTF